MTKQDALLPCPFCGTDAETERSEGYTGRKWFVRCKNSRCYLFIHNKETVFERKVEAINDWNIRAEPELPELPESLKDPMKVLERGQTILDAADQIERLRNLLSLRRTAPGEDCGYDEGYNDAFQAIETEIFPGGLK